MTDLETIKRLKEDEESPAGSAYLKAVEINHAILVASRLPLIMIVDNFGYEHSINAALRELIEIRRQAAIDFIEAREQDKKIMARALFVKCNEDICKLIGIIL